MELTTTRVGNAAVIAVTGDIDTDSGYSLYLAAMDEAANGTPEIVLDLSGVDFVDSVGLGMLVRSRDEVAQEHGAALVLDSPPHRVRQLLDITALTEHFTIRDSPH